MANHPSLTRLAEVMVRTGDQWERGSGYLVAPGWVLTACHVIQGADCVGVWLGMPLELRDEARLDVDSAHVLSAPNADLALLPVSGADSEVERVLFGRLDRGTATPVVAGAAGCPRFKLRPDPGRPAEDVREVHYAWGAISALSQPKTRTYEFAVAVPPSPDPEPYQHSPWEGMSGAAVWADGRLVGVVGQHHEGDPPAILTVLPVEELFAHASASEIGLWRHALDAALPASADEVAVATPPARRTIEEGRTRRLVAALAPSELDNRSTELTVLAGFADSGARWLWVRGDAFAGKTALLASFALHPPAHVDIAACFLRRTTDDCDAEYALDTLNPQLLLLAHPERTYEAAPRVSQRRDDFFDLLNEAARVCKELGHRLVVLIDGLDEDRTKEPGLVIASWLPDDTRLPDNASLLVASRAGATVAIPQAHPLQQGIWDIRPSEAAAEIKRIATEELNQARDGGDLVTPAGVPDAAAGSTPAASQVPTGAGGGRSVQVSISGGQGVQVNINGPGLQANRLAAGGGTGLAATTPGEFRSDVLTLLHAVDDWVCRSGLPPHLAPGADVLHMARTVRMLGRVRRPPDEPGDMPDGPGHVPTREWVYALPAERDKRAEEPPQPWEQVAAGHERLVVLGDPGMGKSWLLRLEAHRLASTALALLEQSAAVGGVAVPVPVRADVLAAAPGRTLAEAVAGYLVGEGLLAARSEGLMRDLIAAGGAVLLVDALDEVPREAAATGAQAPRKRLEDLLRQWAERCPGQARLVVASRLAGYSGPLVPDAREVELLPFTAADIDAAVQAWDLPAQDAARLRGRLRDPAVTGMARVPLLLALICSLAADPHGRRQDLPQTRAGLYEAVVWQFLAGAHRAADRGAPAPALDQAGRQALLQVLTHVAVAFADTNRGWIDRMPHNELLDAIRGASDALADLSGTSAAVLGRLAGQAGILVPAGNPAGGEQDYVFLHRTIAEYLVARHLRDLPVGRRMAIVAEHQWFDPDWAEVIPMLGGLLAAKRPSDEASALVTWFLAQRPDPLHYAFRTAVRILGDVSDPDQLLTSDQERELRRKTTQLLTADATREMLTRTLATASTWPSPITAALLTRLTDGDGLSRSATAVTLAARNTPEVTTAPLTHDWNVPPAAARTLAARDTPEVTATLLARLTDQDGIVRSAAAGALAGRDTPEVTAALLATLLTDQSGIVRSAAAETLAGRDTPEVTAALLTCLTDQNGIVRPAATRALAGRDTPEVTAALLTCLTDQDEFVRSAAARALAGRDTPEVTAALLTCLTDQDEFVRSAAARALAGRDTPEVTAALLTCLTGQDIRISVRSQVVDALAGRDAPEVTAALLACLTDQDEVVRSTAARALARRDTPEVTAALITLLTYRDWHARWEAGEALAKRDTPEVTAALLAHLTHENGLVRWEAARVLAKRDTPEVTAALLTCLTDQNADVRSVASEALAKRDTPEVTAALLALLTHQDWHARCAAVRVLAKRDTPEVTAALLAHLTDQNRFVRSEAAKALARQDMPEVTAALLTCLTDRNWSIRFTAAESLARRDTPEVTAALLPRLTDRNQFVRSAAVHALAGRDEAVILLAVARLRITLARPSRLRERFDLASSIADRVYLKVPPSDRPQLRRRLGDITRRV